MKRLIDVLATAVNTRPDLDTIKNVLFQALTIEGDEDSISSVILGIASQYLKITESDIEMISGSDRVTVADLARMMSLADDLRSRFLMPYTEGTDSIFDDDPFSSYQPSEEYEDTGIIGGNIFVTDSDPRLSDARQPLPHTHDGNVITGVTFGATEPTSKDDGHLWFEPNSTAPQPWTWHGTNSRWRSVVSAVDFPVPASSTGTQTFSKKFPSGTSFIWIRNSSAQLRSNGSGQNTNTDYFSMTLRVLDSGGSSTNLVTFNNQNQALNTSRFSDVTHNVYVANPLYIEMSITRTGSATNLTCTNTALVNVRYVR